MSTTGDNGVMRTDDAVEALLEQAMPRPAPPGKDEKMIREAVFSEWQAVTGKRRSRSRYLRFAAAASVLLGVALTFNMLNDNGVAPVQVASISKSFGSIHVLGEQAEVQELTDLSAIMAGQTIITNVDSGIGIEWGNGGSLRIAADTRIEFLNTEEVFLHSGKVYFDSTPSQLVAGINGGSRDTTLRIRTDLGVVTHLGTQYMLETDGGELVVSVREGQVAINGNYRDEKALDGQRLSIAGSARGSVTNISRYGEPWAWIEEVAPVADTDGRSVSEFLDWVSRETGLIIEYQDAATRQEADGIVLKGKVNLQPRAALDFWLQGQDLKWDINGGTISVSAIDGSSGR